MIIMREQQKGCEEKDGVPPFCSWSSAWAWIRAS